MNECLLYQRYIFATLEGLRIYPPMNSSLATRTLLFYAPKSRVARDINTHTHANSGVFELTIGRTMLTESVKADKNGCFAHVRGVGKSTIVLLFQLLYFSY